MAILIKRYANRKLYNTNTSRYITLKGIAELIEAGEDVRVIDNETNEDITSITLSQILVDTERNRSGASGTLISELIHRGGDALYSALKRGVDDATEGIEEFQRNVRRFLRRSDEASRRGAEWIGVTQADLERLIQRAAERVFGLLDLPRRSDVETLNRNLERLIEELEARPRREPAEPPPPASSSRASGQG